MGGLYLRLGQCRSLRVSGCSRMLSVGASRFVRFTVSYFLCADIDYCCSVIKSWHVFVGYQVVNAFAFIFNCFGKLLPAVATASLYTTLISFLVILITVPAKAPTYQDAKFVFATFLNNMGWSRNGIAFITGFVNVNWGFSCLDTAVHMAEEIHQPERMIPIAIIGTITVGFVTSFGFVIAMMFSLNNFSTIANTPTGAPILELFYQALGNKAGAIVLESLVIATGVGCEIACHTWQSRLCWTFARDRGLPFHKYLVKVDKKLDIPFRAHVTSCVIVAILGCLYMASYTAFNRYPFLSSHASWQE